MTAPKFSDLECGKIRNMFGMVEDMVKLHAKACNTYDDPEASNENHRWALYTGGAIQSMMDGNHLGHELKFTDTRKCPNCGEPTKRVVIDLICCTVCHWKGDT